MTQACTCKSEGENLVFACSGAADIGAIADQAARKMARQGTAKMFCLAGVGGHVADILERTRAAGKIVVIDGCEKDCGKHCMEGANIKSFSHVRITDMGMGKGKSPVSDDRINAVVDKATAAMA